VLTAYLVSISKHAALPPRPAPPRRGGLPAAGPGPGGAQEAQGAEGVQGGAAGDAGHQGERQGLRRLHQEAQEV